MPQRPIKLRALNYSTEQWLSNLFVALACLTRLIPQSFMPHQLTLGLSAGFGLAGGICAMATVIRMRRRPIAMPQDINTGS
ncbi:hypothetical protein [Novosphingobium sp. KACC 22771]|uniref:hypothetical protein n=1 Tax=Novosphingobium sp. KACC 22771 TaxID=3025670 RepID=UPI002365D3CA|nr:hypothetical protein [Novosphingobium sp. KACC 22771]WDF73374.1 hypothetical protein PQ467_04835 [Novosphingobium sp. KACC 22771]